MDTADFVRESNRIEGIHREPRAQEIKMTARFVALTVVSILDLVDLVDTLQPGNSLRDRVGLNVRVGPHIPPPGGPHIRPALEHILSLANRGADPYEVHQLYETLHPFTDCNGRTGRALWLWQMKAAPLGFLHHWYYQSLQASRR